MNHETNNENAEERARALYGKRRVDGPECSSESIDHYRSESDPFSQAVAQFYDILIRAGERGWTLELIAEWRALEGEAGSV